MRQRAVGAGQGAGWIEASWRALSATVEAASLAAHGTETRNLELGRLADGRPFVNVASAGLAAKAARHASPFKKVLGPLAYAVGALRASDLQWLLPCLLVGVGVLGILVSVLRGNGPGGRR